jgi:hypothetical protein
MSETLKTKKPLGRVRRTRRAGCSDRALVQKRRRPSRPPKSQAVRPFVGRERATSLLNRREARGARAMHLCRPLDGGDRANWMVAEQRKSVGVERLLVCVCTATG